ncbi:unnamed protein product [Musa acuminata subsp. burmannicoides]
MDLTPFKLDADELLDEFTEGNYTTLADMKRVWMAKKFSYIYEAKPTSNEAFFMQSLYSYSIRALLRRLGGLYCLYCLYETQPYKPAFKIYYLFISVPWVFEATDTMDVEDAKHIIEDNKLVGDMVDDIVKVWDAQKETFYKQTSIIIHNELGGDR